MNNNELVAIDSTDLETTTGGRAWDTTPTQAAVGQPLGLGATAGTQPSRPGRLGDLTTAPPPPPSRLK